MRESTTFEFPYGSSFFQFSNQEVRLTES